MDGCLCLFQGKGACQATIGFFQWVCQYSDARNCGWAWHTCCQASISASTWCDSPNFTFIMRKSPNVWGIFSRNYKNLSHFLFPRAQANVTRISSGIFPSKFKKQLRQLEFSRRAMSQLCIKESPLVLFKNVLMSSVLAYNSQLQRLAKACLLQNSNYFLVATKKIDLAICWATIMTTLNCTLRCFPWSIITNYIHHPGIEKWKKKSIRVLLHDKPNQASFEHILQAF